MTDPLRQLYQSLSSSCCQYTPEYPRLIQEDNELWQKVKPLLDIDTINALQLSQVGISDETNFIWFREGFRLGASLLLDLL